MATFKGLGVFWGVNGVGFSSPSATGQFQSVNLTTTADEKLIRDGDGDMVSAVHYNNTRTLDIEVIPTGATLALAQTASDNFLIASGTTVTVTDTESLETDAGDGAGAAGVYLLREATMNRSNESEARINMSLFRSDINNICATVAAS